MSNLVGQLCSVITLYRPLPHSGHRSSMWSQGGWFPPMLPGFHWEDTQVYKQRLQMNPSSGQRPALQSTACTEVLFLNTCSTLFLFFSVLKKAALQMNPVACNLQKRTRPVDMMWQVSQNHCPFSFMDDFKATRYAVSQDMPVIKTYLVWTHTYLSKKAGCFYFR